ncbi:MAG: NAD(P)-binding domain-containing protein, partial [bacterium]
MSKLQDLHGKIERREAVIGVIGLGYVGLPLAVELGQAGFRVIGFDVDDSKLSALAQGVSYIGDVEAADLK